MAEIHEGIATAYRERASRPKEADAGAAGRRRRREWSQETMLAASGLVIAASCWSLIEPKKATTLYRQAAQSYRDLGHSFWLVLAFASGNTREIASVHSWIDEQHDLSHLAVAFGMVDDAMGDRESLGDRFERLASQWRHLGNVPIGRLGIPVDNYGQCALAMRAALRHEQRPEIFVSQARNYISRAAEVRRTASSRRLPLETLDVDGAASGARSSGDDHRDVNSLTREFSEFAGRACS